ncbi:unnamed protein product [Caretta caretta]
MNFGELAIQPSTNWGHNMALDYLPFFHHGGAAPASRLQARRVRAANYISQHAILPGDTGCRGMLGPGLGKPSKARRLERCLSLWWWQAALTFDLSEVIVRQLARNRGPCEQGVEAAKLTQTILQ